MVSSSWPPVLAKPSSSKPASPAQYASPDDHSNGSFGALQPYEAWSLSIHPPTVEIDNVSELDVTLVKVESANRHGCLLEVVQILTDLDLNIAKAHISSDGGWFVDVFHVKDQFNRKLVDEEVIEYIKQTLGAKSSSFVSEVKTCLGKSITMKPNTDHTALELTLTDRPGLLSDISTVLAKFGLNVNAAEVWTHMKKAAFLLLINDKVKGGPIEDPKLLQKVKEEVSQIARSSNDKDGSKMDFKIGYTHSERRLHQLMLESKDYEMMNGEGKRRLSASDNLTITVRNCKVTKYSIVKVTCLDRPKLFFDTVCTLTDMQYVVFHATIDTSDGCASQEYYIRHMDGKTLDTKEEQDLVCNCLEAAIERRTPEGTRLELRGKDKVGLLSEVTKKFKERGLTVTMADVSTEKDQVVNTFYVVDADGKPVEKTVVEMLREEIGYNNLQVKDTPAVPIPSSQSDDKSRNSFVNMIRSHSERLLWNFGFGSFSPSNSTLGSLESSRSQVGASARW